MIQAIVISLLWYFSLADCPINNYPRQTFTGLIQAQLYNDPNFHGTPLQYTYALDQILQENGVNIAIGIVGLELNSHGKLDYYIEYIPSTSLSELKFRAVVHDSDYGWRTLTFSFFATQSVLFQASIQIVTQFSGDSLSGKYLVYRPISNLNGFQDEPIIRVLLNGIQLRTKPLDEQYNNMLMQYQTFKKFSTNLQLVNYFTQALELKKSLSYRMYGSRIIGRILTFSIQTNCQLDSLRFSYIMFSKSSLSQRHNYIIGDFNLINSNQYQFSSLQNMNMIITGLTSFKIPRDQFYHFTLIFNNYFGQSYFGSEINYQYFQLGFSYTAFEVKNQFICEDCQKNPIVFQGKFCVNQCPRGYSKISRAGVSYCQKCDIDKLKVINPNTNQCVCANRHYLDFNEDTCKPCPYDCLTCSQNDQCLTCDNGLLQTKRKMNANGKCQCPAFGYYDDRAAQNIVCQICDKKCLTCNGPYAHDCLSCSSNKQLDSNGFCNCKNGYADDGIGGCVCLPPSILYNGICFDTRTVCNQNQTTQYIAISRRCICKPGFIQVSNNCIKCGPNSTFDYRTLTCKCSNQTIYVNGACVPCQNNNNQVYDQFSQKCICKSGTFKSQQGNCISCPPKMAYINRKCECIFNYFESSPGVCSRCMLSTDGPKCNQNNF